MYTYVRILRKANNWRLILPCLFNRIIFRIQLRPLPEPVGGETKYLVPKTVNNIFQHSTHSVFYRTTTYLFPQHSTMFGRKTKPPSQTLTLENNQRLTTPLHTQQHERIGRRISLNLTKHSTTAGRPRHQQQKQTKRWFERCDARMIRYCCTNFTICYILRFGVPPGLGCTRPTPTTPQQHTTHNNADTMVSVAGTQNNHPNTYVNRLDYLSKARRFIKEVHKLWPKLKTKPPVLWANVPNT